MESRNPYIDALRGAAIVLVMLLHFGLAYGFKLPLPTVVPTAWVRAVMVSGNYGVSMFFVVSGFLITSNVLRRYGSLGDVDIKNFYRLRLFRLGPLLLLMLAIITALWAAGLPTFQNTHHKQPLPDWFQWLAIFSVLTFWHNVLIEIVGNWFNYAMNICWSLSVEEVFYLGFPLLIRFVRSGWMLLFVALIFIVAGPAYRWMHSDDENYFLYGYLACFDQISIGCLAAFLVPWIRRCGSGVRKAGAALSAFALAYFYLRGFSGHEAFGFTCVAVATACVLVCVADVDASKRFTRLVLPLSWIGSRSYELYLFHLIVLGSLREIWPRSSIDFEMKLPLMGLFFLLSVIVATLAGVFVGNPLNRYFRRRYSNASNPMDNFQDISARDQDAQPISSALGTVGNADQ
ncbi:acyltransferase family protein [Dyella sp. 20L07]|uniref:acyltransferase family protein n=1 Tax=Dyella sp. 20L07 TaxID=3384240 RepID=UPI003D2ACDA6